MSDVLYGIDRQDIWLPLLKGKRLCVLTHSPAVDREYVRTADVLCRSLNVTALCSPEHGLDGLAGPGDEVGNSVDPETGLPVYSLFQRHADALSLPDALENADAAVCDFCDIGSRFYTYISSMFDAMRICTEKGIPFYVLDRPDPVGGIRCDGTLPDERFLSFVGRFTMPARHGLTLGEAALLFKERIFTGCDLTVIPVSGWCRRMEFEDTGRVWINPSPNMPGPDCARVFCGTCFIEGTNISEGRGTTRPYEQIGSPFIKSAELARIMNSFKIPGIKMRPCRFMPLSGKKYAGEVCEGVQVILTDRRNADCFAAGIRLLDVLRSEVKGFEFSDPVLFDHLLGTDRFRLGMISADELIGQAGEESREFQRSVRNLLIYKD